MSPISCTYLTCAWERLVFFFMGRKHRSVSCVTGLYLRRFITLNLFYGTGLKPCVDGCRRPSIAHAYVAGNRTRTFLDTKNVPGSVVRELTRTWETSACVCEQPYELVTTCNVHRRMTSVTGTDSETIHEVCDVDSVQSERCCAV